MSKAELYWFPVYVSEWLGSAAVSMMLPEQEGAYWRLLVLAWGNGEVEPSLPDDPTALAQMSRLGSRWKRLGPMIRAQFTERDGRLYNQKASDTWRDQQEKHETAVRRASAGGKAKAEKWRADHPVSSSASSTPQAVPEACSESANIELRVKKEPKKRVPPADADGRESWTMRLARIWSEEIGPMKPGRLGAQLKALVDQHGAERVERAMRAYISVTKAEGKTPKFSWFVEQSQVWIERTKAPLDVIDGEMSDTLELLTRPKRGAA